MPDDPSLWVLVVIILLALGFGVVNGFNDAANAIAASVGSRALSPRNAVILAAVFNLAGAATGTAVAQTIGKGILIPEALSYQAVAAGLVAVIVWGAIATYFGLPVSITHSYVAGMVGAGMAVAGSEAIQWGTFQRVLSSVVAAPTLGFVGSFVLMVGLLWLFRRSLPSRMRVVFGRLQWLTTAFLAYSHGKNDGQMPIGVITMAMVIFYKDASLWARLSLFNSETWWIVLISALAISLGTAVGGWRVIKTLGLRVTTLRPVQGFVSDLSAATVIEGASYLGIPVSTTHCASSAIMGVGATRRLSAVRWGIARNIVTAWVLTFPLCGGLGYLVVSLLDGLPL